MEFICVLVLLVILSVFFYYAYHLEQKRVRAEIKYKHDLISVLSDLRDLLKEDMQYYG